MQTGAREVQPGTIGLAVSAITGPPTLLWAAITGDFFPVFSGACMGMAGLGWWIYTRPEERASKQLAEMAVTLEKMRHDREFADAKAIEERTDLRVEVENLRVQNAKLMFEVKKVGNAVANPPLSTPEPDRPAAGAA